MAISCSVAVSLSACAAVAGHPLAGAERIAQPRIVSRSIPVIEVDGLQFRDLDRNGTLTAYEDWRLSPDERAADLLSRMTIEEKAGQMVFANAFSNAPFGQPASGYAMGAVSHLVVGQGITHFNSMLVLPLGQLAEANNTLQDAAEKGRLGIPAVIATDPRHHIASTIGAGVQSGGFSAWPDTTGFAGLGDMALVSQFASTVRRDLRATGFSMLLGPQLDLATEPRWARISGSLGESATSAAPLAAALVEGLQGSADGPTRDGLATVAKHFVGYGAAKDGWDAHNRYGRFAAIDETELNDHLRPFEAAFAVHPSAVMPAYTIAQGLTVDGQAVEPVGAAYSKVLVHDLLRTRFGFDGVVLTDWGVTEDCGEICRNGFPKGERPSFEGMSTAWGVEDLSRPERFARAVSAGVDQFGGVMDTAALLEAIRAGLVTPSQVDEAVGRILRQSFRLGLFEAPFVDPAEAERTAGTSQDRQAARLAQGRVMVRLEDDGSIAGTTSGRVWLHNVDPAAARAAGYEVVEDPAKADFAVLRTAAPHEMLHPGYFFGSIQHEGSLAFAPGDPDIAAIEALPPGLPLAVSIYLDRPAIVTPLKRRANLLLADFGAGDAALFDVLAGRTKAEGTLPFELPSSMDAVEAQRPGTPADSERPLYPLHYYKKN
ncbi:beta-glucosidase (plasmid) [Novosphingobium pentaromativorans US6-1]|nr:beta-glucosidase [Novosphingobium pentaromativorans US6-1]